MGKTTNKQRLLNNIEKALLNESITDEWRDALSFALACVQESYPLFNSKSTVLVKCPICGEEREVCINNLYNIKGMDRCGTCRARSTVKLAAAGITPECLNTEAQKIGRMHCEEIARSCRSKDKLREHIKVIKPLAVNARWNKINL